MPLVKQASKRTTKAATITVLGATGLGFSLLGNASASTMPAADIAQSDNTPPNQRFVLSEEEMADVSLATFHLFDKENVGHFLFAKNEALIGRDIVRLRDIGSGHRGC